MSTVTQVIKNTKQPRGGYLNPRALDVLELDDGQELGHDNIHAPLVGMAVDYLSRLALGASAHDAFSVSLKGANLLGELDNALSLLSHVTGVDDESVASACQLVGYDVVYRNGAHAYSPVSDIVPDDITLGNIRTMVNRTSSFFTTHGPIVLDGFTFDGAFTDTVTAGDGDLLTESTVWDTKVSVKKPTRTTHCNCSCTTLWGCGQLRSYSAPSHTLEFTTRDSMLHTQLRPKESHKKL